MSEDGTRKCSIKGCEQKQQASRCQLHRELHSLCCQRSRLTKNLQLKQPNRNSTGRKKRKGKSKGSNTTKREIQAKLKILEQKVAELHTKLQVQRTSDAKAASKSLFCTYKYTPCLNNRSANSKFCDYHSEAAKLRARKSRLDPNDSEGRKEITRQLQVLHDENSNSERKKWVQISSHVSQEEAFIAATDRRPAHEFGIERGQHRGRPNESITLLCRGSECDVERKVTCTDGSWTVYQYGQHGDHAPARRREYPWSKAQDEVLETEFKRGKTLTTKYLLRKLKQAGLDGDCTEEDIKRKCHAKQVQLGRWDNKGCTTLKELQDVVNLFRVQVQTHKQTDATATLTDIEAYRS